ncbi:MAG: hypothetical protein IT381_31185 [Deltaproteobacteria bacterium]|nr:hypothetical protein [Deltaproteobacteria bacterium]
MQGVVTKRHILRHPWVVIRQFGIGVFFEVLRAPANATFLEIIARHDFKKRRGEELKRVHALDKEARRLQHRALSLQSFTADAAPLIDLLDTLYDEAARLQASHARPKAGDPGDPLMTRFRVLLGQLVAQDGPLRAALGTLSPSELIAVETRVLKSTQKRLKDEFQQIMQHSTTQLDVSKANLLRLYYALDEPARAQAIAKVSEKARAAILAAPA